MNIRKDTARTVIVGPILDSTGALKNDEVVASVLASKNGGDPAALNAEATLTVDGTTGCYRLYLSDHDTDTLGCLELILNSGANTMPPKQLNVMTALAWDALYAASGGLIPSSLDGVLGTALPAESVAGRDAAALGKLLDVETPVFTAASVNQTQDNTFAVIRRLSVSGTLSPDVTGTYNHAGSYNGYPYWARVGGNGYLWVYPYGPTYLFRLSAVFGDTTGVYWVGTDLASMYTAVGETDNAVVSIISRVAVPFPYQSNTGIRTALGMALPDLDTRLSAVATDALAAHNSLDLLSTAGVFTAAALAAAPTGTQVSVSRTKVGETPRVDIYLDQRAVESVAITAESSQLGKTHKLLVYDVDVPGTVLWSVLTAAITIGGTGNKTLTVAFTATNTATAGTYAYELWDTTTPDVVCIGSLNVEARANPA